MNKELIEKCNVLAQRVEKLEADRDALAGISKELIERLREAAAQRVASTAMIGADDLIAAADALEIATAGMNAYCDELGSCRKAAGFGSADDPMAQEGVGAFSDPLCVAAFVESQFKRIVAERDALAVKLKALRGDQTPTTDDINLQNWKGMDGVIAFSLIDRHGDDWNHVARLMNAWLQANREDLAAELKALREQVPFDAGEARFRDAFDAAIRRGDWPSARNGYGYRSPMTQMAWQASFCTVNRLGLYAHPVPTRELTGAVDALAQHIRQIDGNNSMGAGALAESIAEWADRYLKGEGE